MRQTPEQRNGRSLYKQSFALSLTFQLLVEWPPVGLGETQEARLMKPIG
jgi:hypothetical protein